LLFNTLKKGMNLRGTGKGKGRERKGKEGKGREGKGRGERITFQQFCPFSFIA
jgi:hypothetical protein